MSTIAATNLKNPSAGSNNIVLGTDGSTRVTTLADSDGANTSTPAEIASGRAKAWVNFNGTGTVAIRASYNVSSITDNGVGDYTVNFTNALVDSNYVVAMQGPGAFSGSTWPLLPGFVTNSGTATPTLKSSSAVRFCLFNNFASNAGIYDASDCGVAIFR